MTRGRAMKAKVEEGMSEAGVANSKASKYNFFASRSSVRSGPGNWRFFNRVKLVRRL